MEFIIDNLSYSLALFIIGLLTGVALSKILNRGPSVSELQDQIDEAKKNHENYQAQVSSHFQETAQLVNKMSESYKEVHNHLSQGAQMLARPHNEQLDNVAFTALAEATESFTHDDPNIEESSTQETADFIDDDPSANPSELNSLMEEDISEDNEAVFVNDLGDNNGLADNEADQISEQESEDKK